MALGIDSPLKATRVLSALMLEQFEALCPVAVMVRGSFENFLRPERLDEIFHATAVNQYEREVLFSQIVALMFGVANRSHQSVHKAYLDTKSQRNVSAGSMVHL